MTFVDASGPEGERRLDLGGALVLAACAAYAVGLLLVGRALSWDEIEFFRATDAVRQGLVPYRDFYEHHAPLQWFLFAPFSALLHGSGVSTIQAMRWAQLPVWIATLWMLRRSAMLAGAEPRLATAFAAALCASTAFVHSAIEYRVDTVGTFFLVAGLVVGLRTGLQAGLGETRRRRAGIAAGAAFACAGLANLRLAPLLVVAVLVLAIYSPSAGRWRWNGTLPWMTLGIAVALVPLFVYFALHGALDTAIGRLFADNAFADATLERHLGRVLERSMAMFGVIPTTGVTGWRRVLELDLPGLALSALGLWGVARGLLHLRRGSAGAVLAIVQLTNLLFVWRMKAIYDYHFQALVALMVVAAANVVGEDTATDSRKNRRSSRLRLALLAVAAFGLAVNLTNLVQRNMKPTLAYQNLVMTEVERVVPAGGTVWDGVGYALRRPAVRQDLWFLPTLVRGLALAGRIPPLEVADLERDPPGAILFNARMRRWMTDWPDVGRWICRHDAPYRQHEWLPMPNALLTPGAGRAEWSAPSTGDFRVVVSEALGSHPWFLAPLAVGAADGPDKGSLEVRVADHRGLASGELAWTVDGRAVTAAEGIVRLQRGDRIELRWRDVERPAGLFLAPSWMTALFQMAPEGVDLDLPPRFGRLRASPQ